MVEMEHPPGQLWDSCKDHGYKYTRPKRTIAAMYNSPGPSCYGLPTLVGQNTHDPRSVHNKGPAWAFGVRHGKFKDDCSPGPVHLPESKIYRDGKDGTPQYSLYGRNPDLSPFQVPGPGAYSPEHSGPTAQFKHPAYSFGARHRARRSDNTPAPNRYSLDPMLGSTIQSRKKQAPSYSLRPRGKPLAADEGPGPKYYHSDTDVYKQKAPQFSMTSRNVMPGDSTTKPGPGAHSPERVHIHKRAAPATTFGMRHTQYMCVPVMEPSE